MVAEVAGREADLIGPESPFLFNPSLLSGDELIRSFLVRHAQLDELVELVRQAGEAPKHCLVLGEPGMGKTTLLRRVELEVEQDQALSRKWHPIRFDEEQYNLAGLADLWFNCLERLALRGFANAPAVVSNLEESVGGEVGNPLSKDASRRLGNERLERLRGLAAAENLRFVLLVDNFDLVVERLDASGEAHRFREILQQERWLFLIGASSRPIEATYDYRHPLYELFRVVPLLPLTAEETRQVIIGLGDRFRGDRPIAQIVSEREVDLPILRELIAGNLRLTIFLASVLRLSPEAQVGRILYLLMDPFTGIFKRWIDELPPQGQRTLDALLRAWNPATAETIASELRLERGVASGQLHRLVERGLAEKIGLPGRSLGFQARDRFFNSWYLMRGGRRDRVRLESLIAFLELFQRRQRARGPFEDLVTRLNRMKLIPDELSKSLLTASIAGEAETQPDLFEDPAPKSSLLALVKRGDLASAEESARRLLKSPALAQLAHIVLANVLERSGRPEQALEVARAVHAQYAHPRLRLEVIRILLFLGLNREAEEELLQLSPSEQISHADLAAGVARLVRRGGGDLGIFAHKVVRSLREVAPRDPRVLLATCEVEVASERWEQAFLLFREAMLTLRDDSKADRGAALDVALRLAGKHPRETLDCLRAAGFDEQWMPLAEALEVLSGNEERRKELAPEIRTLVEMVIQRIADPNPVES